MLLELEQTMHASKKFKLISYRHKYYGKFKIHIVYDFTYGSF